MHVCRILVNNTAKSTKLPAEGTFKMHVVGSKIIVRRRQGEGSSLGGSLVGIFGVALICSLLCATFLCFCTLIWFGFDLFHLLNKTFVPKHLYLFSPCFYMLVYGFSVRAFSGYEFPGKPKLLWQFSLPFILCFICFWV